MFPLDHSILPHILLPKPIHESHVLQLFSLLPAKPIRNFIPGSPRLKPSLLQFGCNEAPFIRDSHSALPAFVSVYFSSAITLYSELAVWLRSIQFVTLFTFIPRQTLVKGVLLYEASFVSFSVKPSRPASTFNVSSFVHNAEL